MNEKSLLISRRAAAKLLGVSYKQMISAERDNDLSVIKLVKLKTGTIYYKRKEVLSLVGES